MKLGIHWGSDKRYGRWITMGIVGIHGYPTGVAMSDNEKPPRCRYVQRPRNRPDSLLTCMLSGSPYHARMSHAVPKESDLCTLVSATADRRESRRTAIALESHPTEVANTEETDLETTATRKCCAASLCGPSIEAISSAKSDGDMAPAPRRRCVVRITIARPSSTGSFDLDLLGLPCVRNDWTSARPPDADRPADGPHFRHPGFDDRSRTVGLFRGRPRTIYTMRP